ncbi:MAG: hypothetical protein JJT75_10310 [Opitutales bacterium]|nr:hypothetical protein [Opitutales bacterium]
MKTKNITLKVEESVYRQARGRAAREGTSVSAMVQETLTRYSQPEDISNAEEAKRRMSLDVLWKKIDHLPRPVVAGRKFTRAQTYDDRRFHRH